MQCIDFIEGLLIDYVNSELPADVLAECRKHLSHCWRCRQFVLDYKATIDLANSVKDIGMIKWKEDARRGEEPYAYTVKVGSLTICVHQHISNPGRWHLTCAPWFDVAELPDGISAKIAKCMALELVQQELQRVLSLVTSGLQK